MIFGKTIEEKQEDSEKKEELLSKYKEWFAWYSIQIQDHRWVWLQRVEIQWFQSVNGVQWYKIYRLKND